MVVGISLEGSYKKDQVGLKAFIKRLASKSSALRQMIEIIKHDHHMFHPSRESLKELIESNGFKIEKEIWQQAYHKVLYVQAVRLEQQQVGLALSGGH